MRSRKDDWTVDWWSVRRLGTGCALMLALAAARPAAGDLPAGAEVGLGTTCATCHPDPRAVLPAAHLPVPEFAVKVCTTCHVPGHGKARPAQRLLHPPAPGPRQQGRLRRLP